MQTLQSEAGDAAFDLRRTRSPFSCSSRVPWNRSTRLSRHSTLNFVHSL
jgi:hypothetical protein